MFKKQKPDSPVSLAKETWLRLAQHNKRPDCSGLLLCCAPGWNRTNNSGLEVRSYIHLTTGACTESRLPDYSNEVAMGQRVVDDVDVPLAVEDVATASDEVAEDVATTTGGGT